MKKLLTTTLALTAALSLSACATKQISPETRAYYDQTQLTLKQQPVGVLSTACLSKVNLGKDYVFFPQSQGFGQALSETLNQALTNKNLSVSKVITPLVCGQVDNDKLLKAKIQYDKDSKPQEITSAPIVTQDNKFAENTNTAFNKLFSSLGDVKYTSESNTFPLNLDAESIATLKSTFQTNQVFVTVLGGQKPSVTSQVVFGVATVALSGGMYAGAPTQGAGFSIYLVDLNTNQVTWHKQVKNLTKEVFKIPKDGKYSIAVPNLLSPLYETQN